MSAPPPVRILIVDDEASLRKALCDTLRDQGYETVGFATGSAALAAVRESEFDLLLADLMMPEMDGITVLREAIAWDPDLVGIIMTGQGTIDTAVEAMKSGALDYILKPFKLAVILPVLTRALAVRRLRKENAMLERSLRQRTMELEASNKALEAFSYSISHDLRAPLRAINGFSSILLNEYALEMTSEAQGLLNRVTTSARRMEQLIDDLLRFSRLGRQQLTRQSVPLGTLVHEVLTELLGEQRGRSLKVLVGELPDCTGDPALLRQVLVNLLSNAFKFTRQREKGMIEVGSRSGEGETVYFVRDNGAGFDMQYAEKLFGVFQRLHRADEFDGTGIGLSIVERIIARHGGRIWAESEVDQGATFYFTLSDSNSTASSGPVV